MFLIKNSISIILLMNFRLFQLFFPISRLISKNITHREFMKTKQFYQRIWLHIFISEFSSLSLSYQWKSSCLPLWASAKNRYLERKAHVILNISFIQGFRGQKYRWGQTRDSKLWDPNPREKYPGLI